ncbi:MAG: hypothetical protein HY401_08590 [Elusimicrobia bacterium]|nr:hypothetical protein [Elusimicrobiota bacterium]
MILYFPLHFLLLSIIVLGSLALGLKIFSPLTSHLSLPPIALPAGLSLGLALTGLAVLALGQMGLIYPGSLWAIILLLGFSVFWNRRQILDLLKNFSLKNFSLPFKVIVGLALFLLVASAYRPETFFDALVYHLGLPGVFLNEHHTLPAFNHFFLPMPLLQEMLVTLGLGTGGEAVAKMLAVVLGLIAPLTLYIWGKELRDAKTGELAALLFLTTPIIFRNICRLSTEPALAGPLLLGLYFAFKEKVGTDTTFFKKVVSVPTFYSGLFMGIAFSFKYFAGLWCLTLFLFLLFRFIFHKSYLLPTTYYLLSFITGGFAAALPWLLRNLVALGDPLYPYITLALGRHYHPEGWASFQWEAQHWHPGPRVISDIMVILKGSFWDFTGTYFIGPSYLLLLPLALYGILKARSASHLPSTIYYLLSFTGLNWLIGLAVTHYLRYLSPLLAPLALLNSYGVSLFLQQDEQKAATITKGKIFLKTLIVFFLVYHIGWLLQGFRRSTDQKVIFGLISRQDFLRQKFGYYHQAIEWINNNTPQDARILLLGETRPYRFRRRLVYATVHDRHPLADWIEKASDPVELSKKFETEKITHLFHHTAEEARIWGYPMFKLSPRGGGLWEEFRKSYLKKIAINESVAIYKVQGYN